MTRPTIRPANPDELAQAVALPGALVKPNPGVYRLRHQAKVASGVTLDGRGVVTLTKKGLMIKDANHVGIGGVTITDVSGDGITVKRSKHIHLGGLRVSKCSDGLIDINARSEVVVQHSILSDNVRGMLVGNWQEPYEDRKACKVRLEHVHFHNVNVRTPKVQDASVEMINCHIAGFRQKGIDLRGNARVTVVGLSIDYGKKGHEPGWVAEEGSRIVFVDESEETLPFDPSERPTFHPGTPEEFAHAITVEGALVQPNPGVYKLRKRGEVAPGVTIDGRGVVTLTRKGLMLKDASYVGIGGLTITDVSGDGITVKRSKHVDLGGLRVSNCGDGLIDINAASEVTVRHSILSNNVRGMLIGNWQEPLEDRLACKVRLEHVHFVDVNVRTPKVQDGTVEMKHCFLSGFRGKGIDARGQAKVTIEDLHIDYGHKGHEPGWIAEPEASVTHVDSPTQ